MRKRGERGYGEKGACYGQQGRGASGRGVKAKQEGTKKVNRGKR